MGTDNIKEEIQRADKLLRGFSLAEEPEKINPLPQNPNKVVPLPLIPPPVLITVQFDYSLLDFGVTTAWILGGICFGIALSGVIR